jgi:hypothetical protein
MDVEGELELRCEDALCRHVEQGLRRIIYLWDHMPADMVIEGRLLAPRAVRSTGFGLSWQGQTLTTDETEGAIASRHFEPQIREETDIERIQVPRLTEDAERSRRNLEALSEAVGDVLTVEPGGMTNLWFAPWDQLSMWCGVQQMLTDLALRPGFMHRLIDRLVGAHLARLEQVAELGLLLRNDRNVRIGSGGYGYTADLPAADGPGGPVRPPQVWGCAATQPFSEVSPAMHEEFALRYERPWLEHFGLTYYGCCEPLHRKVELLRSVPNLRKVSMSPRADLEVGAQAVGRRYVFSWKPNPAVLATDRWKPKAARKAIREALAKTRGCAVEIIMKDISTVRYEPQRLWEWSRIAVEEAEGAA